MLRMGGCDNHNVSGRTSYTHLIYREERQAMIMSHIIRAQIDAFSSQRRVVNRVDLRIVKLIHEVQEQQS